KQGGGFSERLFARGKDEVQVEAFGPLGKAVFRPEEAKNIVCIAGGSGPAGGINFLWNGAQSGHFHNYTGGGFFGVTTLYDAVYVETLARYVTASNGKLHVTSALSHE